MLFLVTCRNSEGRNFRTQSTRKHANTCAPHPNAFIYTYSSAKQFELSVTDRLSARLAKMPLFARQRNMRHYRSNENKQGKTRGYNP